MPESKTIFLWNRYYPLRRKYLPFTIGFLHPLIALMIANKIHLERNKPMTQITSEVSELLSKKLARSMKIYYPAFSLNSFLGLRDKKETARIGKWGGRREAIPPEDRRAIEEELRKSPVGEVVKAHNLKYQTVYKIGVNAGILNPRTFPRSYYRIPPETEKQIYVLLAQGLPNSFIQETLGVSSTAVRSRRKALGKSKKK